MQALSVTGSQHSTAQTLWEAIRHMVDKLGQNCIAQRGKVINAAEQHSIYELNKKHCALYLMLWRPRARSLKLSSTFVYRMHRPI